MSRKTWKIAASCAALCVAFAATQAAAAINVQVLSSMPQLVSGGDAPAYGLGAMTDKRWGEFYQTMASQGLYPKGLDYTKAYDLRFQRHTFQNFQ